MSASQLSLSSAGGKDTFPESSLSHLTLAQVLSTRHSEGHQSKGGRGLGMTSVCHMGMCDCYPRLSVSQDLESLWKCAPGCGCEGVSRKGPLLNMDSTNPLAGVPR